MFLMLFRATHYSVAGYHCYDIFELNPDCFFFHFENAIKVNFKFDSKAKQSST